jgi:glycosyltransferase involved in cell wall biosynthesis
VSSAQVGNKRRCQDRLHGEPIVEVANMLELWTSLYDAPKPDRYEDATVSRIDLHLHSRASGVAANWWVSGLGLGKATPESTTSPEAAYDLAKAAGMDFVTLTDHESVSGGLTLLDRPDFVLGEEFTVVFPDDGSSVDVLVYGLTLDDHHALQGLRGDVYQFVAALRDMKLPHALAHPLFAPNGRLERAMVEKRILLFSVWETINGARPERQNRIAARVANSIDGTTLRQLAATHGLPVPPHRRIATVAGSDDHAGIAVGTTWTAMPRVETSTDVLAALLAGEVRAEGQHGSVDKLVLTGCRIAAQIVADGGRTSAFQDAPLGRIRDALPLLAILPTPQIRRVVEDRYVQQLASALAQADSSLGVFGLAFKLGAMVDAHLVLAPWLGISGYFSREARKTRDLARAMGHDEQRPVRVAVFVDAIGSTHGVSTFYRNVAMAPEREVELTLVHAEMAEQGLALESIGTLPLPLYGDERLAVPSLLQTLDVIATHEFDLVHIATPGPVGIAAFVAARILGLPVVGAYHTEFGAYAQHLSGDAMLGDLVDLVIRQCCDYCDAMVVPSRSTVEAMARRGYQVDRACVVPNGVDASLFRPDRRDETLRRELGGGRQLLLYCGRLSREKGLEPFAEGYRDLRARRDDVHLVVVGDGPMRGELENRLGATATFTGFLHGDGLARVMASCDLFAFPSQSDTLGRAVTEAQASGLAAVVYEGGGPAECIAQGHTGLVARAGDMEAFIACVERLLDEPVLRARMGVAARERAAGMVWSAVRAELDALYLQLTGAVLAPDVAAMTP